jgi:hypothetical protein
MPATSSVMMTPENVEGESDAPESAAEGDPNGIIV